jgi:altronate hydrolase
MKRALAHHPQSSLTAGLQLQEAAIVMSERDNVAVAKRDIARGTKLNFQGRIIVVADFIPRGHRFALRDIRKGQNVSQYSYPFGISKGIGSGRRVERSNISESAINYESLLNNYAFRKPLSPAVYRPGLKRSFLGYRRKNGEAGTRNYYVIIPTSLCASDVAKRVADQLDSDRRLQKKYPHIDGIIAAAHTEGCGSSDGIIIDRLLRTLKNTIANSNVCGALVVDLGCEKISSDAFLKYAAGGTACGKPLDRVSIQECGGTGKTIAAAKDIVLKRLGRLSIKREEVPIKRLVVGTECGASDSFSGITANPVIGRTVDKIIGAGGAAILSETPEMIGAEGALVGRMVSKKVARAFIAGVRWYKDLAKKLGVPMDGNFVPGNEKGGLVNLTLKSLGSILKGGTTPIVDFLEYGERIGKQGLSIMNGPGNDLESMTGIAASGANIFLFSTGGGATEGNSIAPVIKIASTSGLFNALRDDVDVNAGVLMDDNVSLDAFSDTLLDEVVAVASGKKTRAEIWKKRSFQIWTAGKLSL